MLTPAMRATREVPPIVCKGQHGPPRIRGRTKAGDYRNIGTRVNHSEALQEGFDLPRHSIDVRHAIDLPQQALFLVVRYDWRRLLVICLKPGAHRFGIVVRTPLEVFRAADVAG